MILSYMVYRKKRNYKKKRYNNAKKYRNQVSRIVRPLNVKPRSAIQQVTYYNSFACRPKLHATSGDQQNYCITLQMNSIWPFNSGWDTHATTHGQVCTPNENIQNYSVPVNDSMTIMPNIKDGSSLFLMYAKCCVTGAKVTITATPISNADTSAYPQLGYLYAAKHSQGTAGLTNTSTMNDINKLPYKNMAKLKGSLDEGTGTQIGAKIVIKHSPRKFNNVKDLRDNPDLFCNTGANTQATKPQEGDNLTIGVIPSLNALGNPVTDFCLQIRIEQRLLWTEPLSSLTTGSGNYSFPWSAALYGGGMAALQYI
jgi:hypothetical protein